MAVFNPQVQPTNDPNYLGYSKGIEGGFGVDKSTGIALSTIGEGIDTGASIIDTGIKDTLKDTIRGTVEKERDDYTKYLVSLKNIAQTNKIPGAGSSGDSILDANANADIPDGLQAGLDGAKSLAAATNTGNRINDTLYTARLAGAASDLRNKWGNGYKDYIDKQFAEYSGMNPANAYYKNLMQDINTLAARTDKSGAQSIINEAVKAGDVPDADKIWSLHNKKGPDGQPLMSDDEAIHQISVARQAKAKVTAMETARVASRGDREDTAYNAVRDFSQEMGDNLQRNMSLIQTGTGGRSIKGQIDWLTKVANNPNAVDPKEVQEAVTGLGGLYSKLYSDGMARAAERDSTGQTYITRMGGVKRVEEELTGNLSGLKQYIDSVNRGEFGIGTYLQRTIAAQSQQDQRDLLQDPTLRRGKALQDAFPTYGDLFVKAGLIGNVPEKLNNYLNGIRIDAIVPPVDPTKKATMQAAFNDADAKLGNNPKYTTTDLARLKTEVFNVPKTIADPAAPIAAKANIARWSFDPDNINVLNGIAIEYKDDRGRTVPGKYSAFTRMTQPDITDNMDKVRKGVADGPQIWDNYKTWTQTNFQKLFREDLTTLNAAGIQNPNSEYSLTGPNSKLHIGWSSGEGGQPPRMQLLDDKGNLFDSQKAPGSLGAAARTIDQTITRINSAMYNLHQVYRKDGEDTNMPILRDIMQNWTPDEKVTGLPGQVSTAIMLANRTKLQKMEDTFHPGAKE